MPVKRGRGAVMSEKLKSRSRPSRSGEPDQPHALTSLPGEYDGSDGATAEATHSSEKMSLATSVTQSTTSDKIQRLHDEDDRNNPHAFVVMPFGLKQAPDGKLIDFDAVYAQLIRPSLIEAGFKPFRADDESVSGDILTDMFQELLLADLVVADMSIDNANVFYELGVRHAFRKRGVIHIQSGRDYMPFDVFNVRTMPYHLNEHGVPDPEHKDRDRKNLIRTASETWASDIDAVHSPIFGLLTGLVEPNRRTLRTPLATGFWREFNEWEERITVARRQKRIGDILLLTEEISNPLCKEDAVAQAGLALRELGRHDLALQEYRKGLVINARNLDFRREEAVILNRMGRVDEAILKLEKLLQDVPLDTNATCCLGRIYTAIWQDCWSGKETIDERREYAFHAYQWIVKSIDTYLKGFHLDLNTHEPGIKALNMACILIELSDEFDTMEQSCPDIQRIRALLPDLQSTLRLKLKANLQYNVASYWTLASLAEWHLTQNTSKVTIERAYRKALSYARKNVFHLRSSLKQVKLFRLLGINEESCKVAEEILTSEINRIEGVDDAHSNKEYPLPHTEVQSILFSGHRLDQNVESNARFPTELEQEVQRQIDIALDRNHADWNDHAFVSGAACGGEIIFIEACLNRGMKVHVHMPCSDATFINTAVSYGGDSWIKRFYAIRNNPDVNLYYQEERVGLVREGMDAFERNARWTQFASLVLGIDKLRHISLWDGKSETAEDSEGALIGNMNEHTHELGGIVDHIDITKLEYLFQMNNVVRKHDTGATLSIDARIELLASVALFSTLHRVDLTQIGLVTEERRYEAGAVIVNQGEPGNELFIIASGDISVVVDSSDGTRKIVAQRGRGECVGEMAIVHQEIRMASLIANSEVLLLALSRDNFSTIIRDRPDTSIAVTRTLAERLIEATKYEPDQNLELTC